MVRRTELTNFKRGIADGQKAHEKIFSVTNQQGNTNQNHNITSHLSEWLLLKRTQITCWWGGGEKGTLVWCWWECKLVLALWQTVWRFLNKPKIQLTYDPVIYLGIYLKNKQTNKKTLIWKDTFTLVFMVTLFTTAKIWKQPKVSINRWVDKEDGIYKWIYIMENYLAIKE